jgi:hypothetical protein
MSKGAENEMCKQGESSAFVSPTNRFKLCATNVDYNVKEELECQSDFCKSIRQSNYLNTNDKLV